MVICDRLTDYQVADAFGPTLSLIYKEKMAELNNELQPIYDELDKLDIPQLERDKWFARDTLPQWAKDNYKAIDHINKIRRLYKKIKKDPEMIEEELNIAKAKAVPMAMVFPFTLKNNMLCCPFHEDRTPSMKLNKNNTVKCFSCGFFGDSIRVFEKLNGFTFRDAVKRLGSM